MATTKKTRTPPNGRSGLDAEQVAAMERAAGVPIGEVVEDAERVAQARYEGVETAGPVEFFGRTYLLAPKIGYMPMLDFAHIANQGTTTDEAAALDAMREMLWRCFIRKPPCRRCETCKGTPAGTCVEPDEDGVACGNCEPCDEFAPPNLDGCPQYDPGEWPDFHLAALDNAADAEDLFAVVQQVMVISTARPTRRRSGSSPSAPTGSPSSKGHSSSHREPAGADGLVTIDELAR
jgi:hypothetical protein